MFTPRKKTQGVVGLDIETGSIAATEVRGDGGRAVGRTAIAPLAPGVITDGEVRDPEQLAGVLRELFASHKLGKSVRLGVANQRVVVRTIQLPLIEDPGELDAAMRFRAQDEIPMPLDEAVLDHRVLGKRNGPEGDRQMEVLAVAARRDMVISHAPGYAQGGTGASRHRPLGLRNDPRALVSTRRRWARPRRPRSTAISATSPTWPSPGAASASSPASAHSGSRRSPSGSPSARASRWRMRVTADRGRSRGSARPVRGGRRHLGRQGPRGARGGREQAGRRAAHVARLLRRAGGGLARSSGWRSAASAAPSPGCRSGSSRASGWASSRVAARPLPSGRRRTPRGSPSPTDWRWRSSECVPSTSSHPTSAAATALRCGPGRLLLRPDRRPRLALLGAMALAFTSKQVSDREERGDEPQAGGAAGRGQGAEPAESSPTSARCSEPRAAP